MQKTQDLSLSEVMEALDGKHNHYHKHIRMYVNLKDYRIPFNDNWMFDDLEDLDDDIL